VSDDNPCFNSAGLRVAESTRSRMTPPMLGTFASGRKATRYVHLPLIVNAL
jgi:hypothetical protein